MTQYGFLFDQSRCTGCQTCAVACKNWNGLPPGPLKYLRIYDYEKGSFPNLRVHSQWIPCYHCEEPVCVISCPSGAMYKEESYGAVLIDSEKCDGCRICYEVCPYGAPVFESNEVGVCAQKCNMCIQRLKQGLQPVCVLSCPTRALDFGLLNVLIERYGDTRDIEDMPSSRTTNPAIVFKSHARKRQLVPYNSGRALELLMRKEPLLPGSTSATDLIDILRGTIGRNELVIKHKSVADFMRYTRNDEG